MNLAKASPGTIDTSYVSGMNINSASTGIVRSQMSVNQIVQYNAASTSNVGAYDYTLLMYCPVLSIVKGGSGFANA